MANQEVTALLTRIADSLERLAPPPPAANDLSAADAFVWHADQKSFDPVHSVNRLDLSLLKGIEQQCGTLLENTRQFANRLPANNAL